MEGQEARPLIWPGSVTQTAGVSSSPAWAASACSRLSFSAFWIISDTLMIMVPKVEAARGILERGTSADRQVAAYKKQIAAGTSHGAALRGVVDHLIAETRDVG